MTESTGALEWSYRRYTRLFPPPYRAAREDEMLAVLMEAAPAGQSRASLPEALDLIRSAALQWLFYVLGPDRASRRAGAAVLAVLLPAAFFYGVGMTLSTVATLPAAAMRGYLSADRYWVVWVAWAVVNVALLARSPRWARAVAVVATLLYLALMGHSLWRLGPNPFAPALSWLAVQLLATWLLLRRDRIETGFGLVPRWWQAGVGLIAFGFGASYAWWSTHRGSPALWLLTVVALGVGLAMMRTAAGRVIVPILGGLVAFAAITRVWQGNIRSYDHSGLSWVQLSDVVLLVAVPLATLVLLRIVAASLDRTAADPDRGDR